MALHVDYTLDISDLPDECIADCSHRGDNSEAVEYWQRKLGFTVNRERAVECLSGYGAWEDEELASWSDDRVAQYILFLACGNFSEQRTWEAENPGKPSEDSDYGTSCFVLE